MSKTLFIITGSMTRGGLEKITSLIANYYASKKWKVCILTLFQKTATSEWDLEESVNILPVKSKVNLNKHRVIAIPIWLRFIRKTLESYKPSSILCMTMRIGALAAIACPKMRKQIVVREINDPKSPKRNQLENKFDSLLLKNIKGFIFQTQWEKSCYCKRIQDKAFIIPNPCSIQRTPLFSFDNRIVCVSRLENRQKRIDVALNIFAKLEQKYPNLRLEIYGTGRDATYLENLADKLKCRGKIKFMGLHCNIPEKIEGARCYLITSDFEGMSNSLLEANLLGIPCVSSNWNGVESVIRNNYNGLIYTRQNIEEAASKIESLIRNDNLCLNLAKAGFNEREKYSQEKILEKYAVVING